MSNSICRNHETYREYLSAHRLAYGLAKSGRKQEILISFSPALFCLFAYQICPTRYEGELVSSSAFLAVIVLLICDLVLEPVRIKHRRQANLDLEAYDTGILELPWNEAVSGRKPSKESIASAAADYEKTIAQAHPPELSLDDSWFPPVLESIDIDRARVYCQRQNCSFELMYRKKYIQYFLLPMIFITLILVLAQAYVFGFKLNNVMLSLIITAPIFRILIQGLLVQSGNIKSIAALREDIDTLRLSDEKITVKHGREFQDRLFATRDTLPLISIGGFKIIKSKYVPLLKKETETLLSKDSHAQNNA